MTTGTMEAMHPWWAVLLGWAIVTTLHKSGQFLMLLGAGLRTRRCWPPHPTLLAAGASFLCCFCRCSFYGLWLLDFYTPQVNKSYDEYVWMLRVFGRNRDCLQYKLLMQLPVVLLPFLMRRFFSNWRDHWFATDIGAADLKRQDSSVEDMLTKSDNVTFVACVCNAVVTAMFIAGGESFLDFRVYLRLWQAACNVVLVYSYAKDFILNYESFHELLHFHDGGHDGDSFSHESSYENHNLNGRQAGYMLLLTVAMFAADIGITWYWTGMRTRDIYQGGYIAVVRAGEAYMFCVLYEDADHEHRAALRAAHED